MSSFGFPPLSSNALASVGLFLQIPMSFSFSVVSDRLWVLYFALDLTKLTACDAATDEERRSSQA